ncbi:unnamed protein product [Caenorhabditis bovis]|uniref:Uncharacterized protein n=1 Tax=Caenorhabditis bovis TaxID=2654633 RepID=A0A8S1EXA1_9PELO|nr:unnamed protein product [Caenorhabditis bovis]
MVEAFRYFANPHLCLLKLENSRIAIIDPNEFPLDITDIRSSPSFVVFVGDEMPSSLAAHFLFHNALAVFATRRERVVSLVARLQITNDHREIKAVNVIHGDDSDGNYALLSTLRNDVKEAVNGDYCIPNDISADVEKVVAEIGRERVLEILGMKDTEAINQKKFENKTVDMFFRKIYHDHLFDYDENVMGFDTSTQRYDPIAYNYTLISLDQCHNVPP